MRGRVNSAFFVVRDVMLVLGMALAGLADIVNVRSLFIVSSFALLLAGTVVLVLPGLGQPAAEWKRTISLLRGSEAAPRLGAGRTATRSQIDRFILYMKEMEGMNTKERDQLATQTLVATAPGGKIVVYRGETSDMAYFILKGSAAAGYLKDDDYVITNYLQEGDFFGEIAALTGSTRTANIITEEEREFLIIPSKVMRQLAKQYDGLRQVFYTTMAQRLSKIELPRGTSLDQDLLRELRTNMPALDEPPGA
jgi:CRP-like cAMP-binding protein